ncbi:MAG TPA: ABC transporter permease [Geminicoccus sp.]|uniref:ABC transporter permease n=1 Tax=Geminicoccus sp. TaxID=2024832 RepID=UPI002C378E4F|nr:ABC transporter permease [Geminicoccus sp.]HWL70981.1 ABC transporter permease [Geminicoccus sp.]
MGTDGRALRRFLRNPSAWLGLLVMAAVLLMAATAGLFYPGDPQGMVAKPYLWPGQDPAFPLGTDNLGRDVTAGVFHGARVSLWIGVVSAAICLTIGTLVGAIGGYFGGWTDDLLTRLTEAVQTMPSFLFLIVLVAIFQPTLTTITLGIGLVSWPTVARLVRAEFRRLRGQDFVLAARSLGFPHWRIIFQEILPNALPPLIVTTSVIVASAILTESALAFLGLGDPNVLSWGMMIGNGRAVIRTAWYLSAVPGALIVLTVLAVNLLGEALNDAANPRLGN